MRLMTFVHLQKIKISLFKIGANIAKNELRKLHTRLPELEKEFLRDAPRPQPQKFDND